MLAGRKLLLADDSATIQKVVDLTFADEGVRVLAVSNGQEAIEQLLEFAPDIVLADVFMPSPNGYEVCEYVKTNDQLKHIPVMLLVGSFEPFDEAEARRVGADDILTKPFQSIRRLIDRVGALVSSPPVEKESPTAELPKVDEPAEEPRLDAQELEVTTADTMPLPGDSLVDTMPRIEHPVVATEAVSSQTSPEAPVQAWTESSAQEGTESSVHEGTMEPGITENDSRTESSSEVLLDLDDLEPARAVASDDFVLELDDDQESAYQHAPMRAFVEPEVKEATATVGSYESNYQSSYQQDSYPAETSPETFSPFAETQEAPYAAEVHDVASAEPETYEPRSVPPEFTPDPVPVFGEAEFPVAEATAAPATSITAAQLSPEMIDAIARRAVELMSDKVIREIAWEVVPDLAELLIKRQLEEKSAK